MFRKYHFHPPFFLPIAIFSLLMQYCSPQKPAGLRELQAGRVHKGQVVAADPLPGVEVVFISKSGCKGKCPKYKASFLSGGRLIFEGIAHVKLIGKFEFVIPEKMVENMLIEANRIKYHNYNNKYPGNEGEQSTTTRLLLNGRSKEIVVQGSTPTAPAPLVRYQQSIHDEVMAIITEQPPGTETDGKSIKGK